MILLNRGLAFDRKFATLLLIAILDLLSIIKTSLPMSTSPKQRPALAQTTNMSTSTSTPAPISQPTRQQKHPNATITLRRSNRTANARLLAPNGAEEFSIAADDGHARRSTGRHQTGGHNSPIREGVAEVQRVERNVHKKLELLDGRVDQIQSMIDENHRLPAPVSTDTNGYNSSAETGSLDANLSQDGEFGQRSDSSIKSANEATMSSGPVVNNIEAPTTTNEVWSTRDSARNDQDSSESAYDSSSEKAHRKQNLPIIQSVIPGRSPSSTSQPPAPISGSLSAATDNLTVLDFDGGASSDSDSSEKSRTDDQQAPTVQDLADDQGPSDNMKATPSTSAANYANHTTQETPQAMPSMMGPEWSLHQNYDFFREINAKNHGDNNHRRVDPSDQFKPVAPAQTSAIRGRFPNMTIVNSDADLVKSFSQIQPSPSHQTSTKKPSSSSGDQMLGLTSTVPTQRKSSGVHTYSGSNYGKSSKDLSRSQVNRPVSYSNVDNAVYNDSISPKSSNSISEPPLKWPQFATSYSNSHSSDTNQQDNTIGLPPGSSSTGTNHYSSIMRPADSISATQSQETGRMNRASGSAGEQDQQQRGGKYSPLIGISTEQPSSGEQQLSGSISGNNNNNFDLKHRSSQGGMDESSTVNLSNVDHFNALGSSNHEMGSSYSPSQTGHADLNTVALAQPGQDSPNLDYSDQAASTGYSGSRVQQMGSQDRNYHQLQSSSDGASIAPDSSYSQMANYQPVTTNIRPGSAPPTTEAGSQIPSPVDSAGNSGSDADGTYDQTRAALYQLAMQRIQQQQQQLQPTLTDSMQPAATSSNLVRQRQLSQMAANIMAQNQQLSHPNFNALLQRYQQQQRSLAAQLQQQQQLEASNSAGSQSPTANSISRSFYVTPSEQAQPGEALTMARRYSPETLASYLNRVAAIYPQQHQQNPQQFLTNADYAQVDAASSNDIMMPYSVVNNQYQTVGPASHFYAPQGAGAYSPTALRAANLAYLKQALASASTRNSAAMNQAMTADSSPPTTYYVQPQAQSQITTARAGIPSSAHASPASSLFATAAMNSPVFYDSSSQHQKSIQTSESSQSTASNQGSELPSPVDGSSAQQQSQRQYSSVSGPYKRSYLNHLFKPTASSRYYYTPTILSPISFAASPSALNSIYAPAMAAADPMASLQQLYTATAANPFAHLAAAPTTLAGTAVDPSQQYQAFAAASGLQPQYIADTEMAESSLVPSDTSGSLASDGGQSGDDISSSSASSSASKSGSKSATPWTNIAGLLLGILPFGILMASLLPAVTVAGRKKRELEFSGRNFSDLLKWRPPSRVLNAIIGKSGELSLSNATAIINEQFANLAHKSSNNKNQETDRRHQLERRRSLTSVGFLKPNGNTAEQSSIQKPTTELANFDSANSTTLSSPTSSTTPLPNLMSNQTTSVKARVKKAFNVLNSFITAAQNIKRKHRSSIIDNQWSLPALLKSTIKLDNLFNVEEYKRNLAALVHARLLAAQRQLLQQQRRSSLSATENRAADRKVDSTQNMGSLAREQPADSKPSIGAVREPLNPPLPDPQPTDFDNSTQKLAGSVTLDELDQEIRNSSQYSTAFKIKPLPLPETSADHATTMTTTTLPKPPTVDSLLPVKNSTLNHLEVCLNQFLCRLAVKLNTSLSHSIAADKGGEKSTNSSAIQAGQFEKITKKYIYRLVDQIESEHPAVSLGLKPKKEFAHKDNSNQESLQDGLDTLYKSAMKNQCSSIYTCVELLQLERTLAKMKLKLS